MNGTGAEVVLADLQEKLDKADKEIEKLEVENERRWVVIIKKDLTRLEATKKF